VVDAPCIALALGIILLLSYEILIDLHHVVWGNEGGRNVLLVAEPDQLLEAEDTVEVLEVKACVVVLLVLGGVELVHHSQLLVIVFQNPLDLGGGHEVINVLSLLLLLLSVRLRFLDKVVHSLLQELLVGLLGLFGLLLTHDDVVSEFRRPRKVGPQLLFLLQKKVFSDLLLHFLFDLSLGFFQLLLLLELRDVRRLDLVDFLLLNLCLLLESNSVLLAQLFFFLLLGLGLQLFVLVDLHLPASVVGILDKLLDMVVSLHPPRFSLRLPR